MKAEDKVRLIGVLALLSIGGIFLNTILDIKKAKEVDSLQISNINYKDYFDLFDTSVQQNLKVESSYSSRNRNPIIFYNYADNKIIIYKISSLFNEKLNNINLYSSEEKSSKGPIYGFIRHNKVEFMYKIGRMDKAKDINIGYNGDDLKYNIKNDSTLSLSFTIKDFFIKFGKNNDINLFISYNNNKTPICVQLIKRHKELYLLVFYNDLYKSINKDLRVN